MNVFLFYNFLIQKMCVFRPNLVLGIGSNLGLKFGRECPIRVLSTDPKIRKQIIITNLYLIVYKNILVSISSCHTFTIIIKRRRYLFA